MALNFVLTDTHDETRRILIELVGFWHPNYLCCKVEKSVPPTVTTSSSYSRSQNLLSKWNIVAPVFLSLFGKPGGEIELLR